MSLFHTLTLLSPKQAAVLGSLNVSMSHCVNCICSKPPGVPPVGTANICLARCNKSCGRQLDLCCLCPC